MYGPSPAVLQRIGANAVLPLNQMGPVVRRPDNTIHRLVIILNFLKYYVDLSNPD